MAQEAVANASSADSCATFGCIGYVSWHPCQCNDLCRDFSNCCDDFAEACLPSSSTPEPASPAPAVGEPVPAPAPGGTEANQGEVPAHPPATALDYKGMAWPAMRLPGTGEKHVFAIGDWGGMDGSLITTGGRPRVIAYKGGQTPGAHVFPRTRWNKPHSELLCSHDEFVDCFNGEACAEGCGFVEDVDSKPQYLVAKAFKARAVEKNPDYVFNVGDSFYWGGIEVDCGAPMSTITATAHHQFDQIFEGVYSGTGLDGKPWLSVLGNHDWGGRVFNNGWDQQIAYTWASQRWIMPAPYWSQRVDYPDLGFSMDLFMTDSNAMDAKHPDEDPEHNLCGAKHNSPGASCAAAGGPASLDECYDFFWDLWNEQKPWLQQKLSESQADWQIVVTHFPCHHESGFYADLHLQYGLDLLVTGHRHDQELQDRSGPGGMTCLVTGGGGGITSEATPGEDHSNWYGEAQYGFYDLTVAKDRISIESINWDGTVMKTATVYPS